jgi:hypothetical protein
MDVQEAPSICYFIQEMCDAVKKTSRPLFPCFTGFNLKVEAADFSKYAAMGTSNHFRYTTLNVNQSLFRPITFPEGCRRLCLPYFETVVT